MSVFITTLSRLIQETSCQNTSEFASAQAFDGLSRFNKVRRSVFTVGSVIPWAGVLERMKKKERKKALCFLIVLAMRPVNLKFHYHDFPASTDCILELRVRMNHLSLKLLLQEYFY